MSDSRKKKVRANGSARRKYNKYYNWNDTISKNVPFNIVVSARGIGKTYGLRLQCIRDFIKNGSRFVEIVRYKTELEGEDSIARGYFDKINMNREFPGLIFMVQGTKAYIAREPANDKEKPDWKLIGYFVALSDMQKTKKRTFANVKRVIFDEFVIDKRTRTRYLPGEYDLFVNTIDSLAREEVSNKGEARGTKLRIYLLGNACDLMNPYFVRFGIDKVPPFGYTKINDNVLIHYVKDDVYSKGKKDTLVGRLLEGSSEYNTIVSNVFDTGGAEYEIAKKTPRSIFMYAFVFMGKYLAVWMDDKGGYLYVNNRIPKNDNNLIFYLTREDNTINRIMMKKSDDRLKTLMDLYANKCIKFESYAIRELFFSLMSWSGVDRNF